MRTKLCTPFIIQHPFVVFCYVFVHCCFLSFLLFFCVLCFVFYVFLCFCCFCVLCFMFFLLFGSGASYRSGMGVVLATDPGGCGVVVVGVMFLLNFVQFCQVLGGSLGGSLGLRTCYNLDLALHTGR
jgi:hypothetical protein